MSRSQGKRTALRTAIARALKDETFRTALTAIAPDGTRPVVPAFVDDPIRLVFKQLAPHGGVGNVVIPWEGHLTVLSIGAGVVDAGATGDACQPVGGSAPVGFLLAVMAQEGLTDIVIEITKGLPEGPRIVNGHRTTPEVLEVV